MKKPGHPDFIRIAAFVTAGAFAGAGVLFVLLLLFTGRSPEGPITDILPDSAATDHTRDLIRQTETLRDLVRSYDQQLESDRRLIEQQQTLIARLESSQNVVARPESAAIETNEGEGEPAARATPASSPLDTAPIEETASLPSVSAAPPPAPVVQVAIVGETEAFLPPETGENPQTESLRPPWPRGLFDIVIRNEGAALRAEPATADDEPMRILQAGGTFTVTRVLTREDGVWYELRRGWIKHSSRIEQIEPGSDEPNANLLLPDQFQVRIHRGVNLYPAPSSQSIWNLKLLKDGEQHVVTSERQQDDGTWYELRYGWVKMTDRIAKLELH